MHSSSTLNLLLFMFYFFVLVIRFITNMTFLLCLLSLIVTWQYNPNPLDSNWPCTVINYHDWQRNCPLQLKAYKCIPFLRDNACTMYACDSLCASTGLERKAGSGHRNTRLSLHTDEPRTRFNFPRLIWITTGNNGTCTTEK